MPSITTFTRPRMDLGQAFLEAPISNAGFIGTQILPFFDTPVRSGSFTAIDRQAILRIREVSRAAGAAYARGDYEGSEIFFTCHEYGYEKKLGDEMRELYASDFDAELMTAQLAMNVVERAMEYRIAATINDTNVWTGAALTTTPATPWDSSSATIVADIDAAKEKVRKNCGVRANTVVLSASQIPWIKANTDIKSRIQYVSGLTDSVIVGSLPGLFGVEKVLIGGAIYNTSDQGIAYSGADIWDDNYCWVGVTANTNSLAEPCVGRTFRWVSDAPEAVMVEEYREEQTRSSVFRARQYVCEKIIDPYFGHLLIVDT